MSEHVHEWTGFTSIANYPVKDSNPPTVYVCTHCQKEMKFSEVESRLNATERLSTGTVFLGLDEYGEDGYMNDTLLSSLRAYAAALEDDDD